MLADDLRFALDPVTFAESLGFHPDPWQSKALTWAGRRMLLNCSRQSGKSTTAALLAVHTANYHPESLILLVSPSLRQSGELFRKVKDWFDLMENRPTFQEDNVLSCELNNGSRIVSLPSSAATVRGFSGVTLIIEDESSQVPDELYRALRPMLAVSGGKLILMSTPYGRRGHYFEEWTHGGPEWQRIEIPAKQCPRITREFLAEERRSLGSLFYSQEYECVFVDTINTLFGLDLIRSCVDPTIKPMFGG